MNVLPWLLNWPPSKRQVLLVLGVNALLLGGLVAVGAPFLAAMDTEASVESANLTLELNDEWDVPDTGNGTRTCLSVGVPPDTLRLTGSVTVANASDAGTLALSLPETGDRTMTPIAGGRERVSATFADDETLAVGDRTAVVARVLADGKPVANATTNLTVENGTYELRDCSAA